MKKRTTSKQQETPPLIAVGVLIPVEWDPDGNPVAVALSAQGETEYLIDLRNDQGRKLLGLLQEKIEIIGQPGKLVNNRPMLKVANFRKFSV